MIQIRILAVWWLKYFMCTTVLLLAQSLLCTVICILTVSVTLYSSNTFSIGRILHLMPEISHCRYQNDDQCVSLILKWDPRITNFLIPDPGIQNSIPGLQSLSSKCANWSCVMDVCSIMFASKNQFSYSTRPLRTTQPGHPWPTACMAKWVLAIVTATARKDMTSSV